VSEEQLEYSAKLLADNISLEKRNKEIYEGFMTTTQELCEATKEIERLHSIIKEVREYIESYGITKEQLKKMSFGSAAPISIGEMLNILEILDKANDREDK